VAAPQAGEHRVGLLGHLGVDERRVVGLAELGPLLVDDLDVGPQLLQVRDERLGQILAERVVRTHRRHFLHLPLGHQLGGGAAFDGGGGGGAEHIGMQVGRRGQLVGLDHRHHEHGLVLLGHRRHRRAFGRRERAHQEVDVLAQDQVARDAHRLVGIALGVAHQQLELAAEHAAFGVGLVDEHLRAFQRRLADQCTRPGQDHRVADADRFGLRAGVRCQQRDARGGANRGGEQVSPRSHGRLRVGGGRLPRPLGGAPCVGQFFLI
jgi:hypothetical protein